MSTIPADTTALAAIRWCVDQIESLAIRVYLNADVTNPDCPAQAYRKVLDDPDGIISALAGAFSGIANAGGLAAVATLAVIQETKKKDTTDCPPGWCSDGMNCYPCYSESDNKAAYIFPRIVFVKPDGSQKPRVRVRRGVRR